MPAPSPGLYPSPLLLPGDAAPAPPRAAHMTSGHEDASAAVSSARVRMALSSTTEEAR